MRTLGLLAILCTTLSYSAVDFAEAAPDAPLARQGERGPAKRSDSRQERMERIESFALARVQKIDSKRYQALIDLKTKRPRVYRHLMMRAGRSLRSADKDPNVEQRFLMLIDLTVEMGSLADGFDTLSASQQTRRRAELVEVMGKMFELKQEGQRVRLAAMEERLAKIRLEIETKDAAKQEIVDGMVQRILKPRASKPAGPRR